MFQKIMLKAIALIMAGAMAFTAIDNHYYASAFSIGALWTALKPAVFRGVVSAAVGAIFNKAVSGVKSLFGYVDPLEDISNTLEEIQTQLNDLDSQMNEQFNNVNVQLSTISDQNNRAAYQTKVDQLNEIKTSYSGAWDAYENMINQAASSAVTSLNPEVCMNEILDEISGNTLNEKIANIEKDMSALCMVIAGVERLNPDAVSPLDENTLLGTAITILRGQYPFEHQVRPRAQVILTYSLEVYRQLYVLDQELTTYRWLEEHHSTPDDPLQVPDDLFSAQEGIYLDSIAAICQKSGIDSMMVSKSDPNYPEDDQYAPGETKAEVVETTFDGEGFSCPAFHVRYNIPAVNGGGTEDYMILQDASQTTFDSGATWDGSVGGLQEDNWSARVSSHGEKVAQYPLSEIYETLEQGSADGKYALPASRDDLTILQSAGIKDAIGYLAQNLSSPTEMIDENADVILTTDYQAKREIYKFNIGSGKKRTGIKNSYDETFPMARDISQSLSASSEDLAYRCDSNVEFPNPSTGGTVSKRLSDAKCLVIFQARDDLSATGYQTFTPTASSQLDGKSYVLGDGQTLDLTKMTTTTANVSLYVNGSATIIGDPTMTYQGVSIQLMDGADLTVQNLNIVGQDRKDVITSYGTDVSLTLQGTNSFTANVSNPQDQTLNGAKSWERSDHQYSGLRIDESSSLYLTGKRGAFNGANGGCGIEVYGNLDVDNADIEAYGSRGSSECNGGSYGAGIGGIVTVNYVNVTSNKRSYTWLFDVASDSVGEINIVSSRVIAGSGDGSIQAIGAVSSDKDASGGKITNSIINLANAKMDSRIQTDSSDAINQVWDTGTYL